MIHAHHIARRLLVTLGSCAAFAATALCAGAQTTHQQTLEGTLLCRPAYADEAASAKLVSNATTLVCRPIAVAMRKGDGTMHVIGDVHATPQSGPNLSEALTPAQMRATCEQWLETFFHIDHTS